MSPRSRKNKNRDLPANLYESDGLYRYRRPTDRKMVSLGSDRQEAIKAAIEANKLLSPASQELVERIVAGGEFTVPQMIERLKTEYYGQREYSTKTLTDYYSILNRVSKAWSNKRPHELTVADTSELVNAQTPRVARQFIGRLSDLFRFCCSQGVMHDDLTREVLVLAQHRVKRQRLTYEDLKAIREQAEPWFQRAMDVALHSLQRREDLALLRFDQVKDDRLPVEQIKTGVVVDIEVQGELRKALRACRDDILSPYVIHKRPTRITDKSRAKRDHHTQVLPEQLTRAFSAARDAAGVHADLPSRERPSFHEIRALGAHMYEEAGIYPQGLLGHLDQKTTELYLSRHKQKVIPAVGGIPNLD